MVRARDRRRRRPADPRDTRRPLPAGEPVPGPGARPRPPGRHGARDRVASRGARRPVRTPHGPPWRRTGTSTTPAGCTSSRRSSCTATTRRRSRTRERVRLAPDRGLPARGALGLRPAGVAAHRAAARGVRARRLRRRARGADADRRRGRRDRSFGDRRLTVLHLPGHTPGEIGLWEEATRTLFSGDCVYESGILLDELPESNIPDYVRSMERLREVPVRIVHGGHDDSFGRPRLLELIDGYVRART